jgi:hypothetical protein
VRWISIQYHGDSIASRSENLAYSFTQRRRRPASEALLTVSTGLRQLPRHQLVFDTHPPLTSLFFELVFISRRMDHLFRNLLDFATHGCKDTWSKKVHISAGFTLGGHHIESALGPTLFMSILKMIWFLGGTLRSIGSLPGIGNISSWDESYSRQMIEVCVGGVMIFNHTANSHLRDLLSTQRNTRGGNVIGTCAWN